jgi:hypothetical protein
MVAAHHRIAWCAAEAGRCGYFEDESAEPKKAQTFTPSQRPNARKNFSTPSRPGAKCFLTSPYVESGYRKPETARRYTGTSGD